jgi:hypothetical protein
MIPVDEEFEELPEHAPAWQARDAIATYRKHLLAAGYLPLPVNGKNVLIHNWSQITATNVIIDNWTDEKFDHLSTGILTRTTPAIDIDVTDEEVAEELEELVENMLGKSAVRIGRAPKRAILFRADAPFSKLAAAFISPSGHNHKVEILANGQQIVVNGIHPETHQPYRWHGGEPGPDLRADQLPLLTAEMAAAFLAAASELMTNRGWHPVDNKKSNGAGNSSGYDEDAPIRERAYASAALDGCAEELARTPVGGRNNSLYKKSFRIGTMVARGWLARTEAEAVLFDGAMACGLIADDGEAQTRKTIRSGLDDGKTVPHPDLDEQKTSDDNWEDAKPRDTDDPMPLFPPLPPAARFPVEALGDVLSKATLAIARKVQLPKVIAAQSVLGAAALAAQAIADVRMPYGDTRPISLFFTTVAASGDRKTTADKSALWPIRKFEDALKEKYRTEYERWDVKHAAWAAERKKIENNKKIERYERENQLTRLGPKPPPPLQPFLTAAEPTIEGLIKIWVYAPAALGIFSAEGGQFIGGYGMSQDHRLKTAAALSGMWDGAKISRVRGGDGSTILKGRRLSLHLMVQPDAAATFLSDPVLRNQGLLSRVLVAHPDSIAGTRVYRNTEAADEDTIRAYGARILSILESPWPMADGERNELAPPALTLDAGAFGVWKEFHNGVEVRCGQNSELAVIADFAAKAAEQAARIAGVLTIVDDHLATEIKTATMCDAVIIAGWYVNETLRLQQAARTDPKLVRAQRLLDWLQQHGSEIDLRDILRFGPAHERTKAAAYETLQILIAHGWVRVVSKRPYRVAVTVAA